MNKRLLTTLITASIATTGFAAQVSCPNGLTFVNIGVSQSAFTKACGKPNKTESTTDKGAIGGYYVWRYRQSQIQQSRTNMLSHTSSEGNTQVLAIIHNGKIGALRYLSSGTMGGQMNRLMSSFRCQGGTIAVGDTSGRLERACGQPMSKEQLNNLPGHPDKKLPQATMLEYKVPNMPLVRYGFVNGKLVGKK